MTDEDFTKQLALLQERIETLPADQRERLYALVDETKRRQSELTRNVAQTRDALDDWRLSMKYLVFDMEAGTRERGPSHGTDTEQIE
ncbi:MAG: hypothetical protein MI923_30210 [Phycisphaerales bacterium]|nr:hypothetical protein [Phycisphaerales bacterium]